MFGIGLPEMIVIAIVALVFIGPKNLPGVLRSVGRGLVQLKLSLIHISEPTRPY